MNPQPDLWELWCIYSQRMPCCEDFWEWFCDLVIKSEEADPYNVDNEGLFTFELIFTF